MARLLTSLSKRTDAAELTSITTLFGMTPKQIHCIAKTCLDQRRKIHEMP